MKLTHGSLTTLGRLLGYSLFDDQGMCRGFSAMLALAILANEESSFYERLDFIEQYQQNFNRLVHKIESTRNRLKWDKQNPLSPKDWKKLEVPAFFEGAGVYLRPHLQKPLFNNVFLNQENIKEIYPLVHSKALENQNISILLDREWVFDPGSLEIWLTDLAEVLSHANSPVPIILDSPIHSVCFKYDRKKQCWVFTDINDFDRFPDAKKYYRELTTKKLAKSIFTNFSDNWLGNTLFTTTALVVNPDEALKKAITNFESKYTTTSEQAFLYNHDNASLLNIAAENGHLNAVNKLIEFGAEINHAKYSSRSTPLFIASQNGYLNVVNTLLRAGAKVNQANANGLTPLFTACQFGHLDVISILLKSGAEVNQASNNGCTPLFMATQGGHLNAVKLLLKSHAKVNQATPDGFTPLNIACEMGSLDIAITLIKSDADVNQATKEGITPLYMASQQGHLILVNKLIQSGAKVNQASEHGWTPLHIACENGYLDVVSKLLESADVNQATKDDITPLHMASLKGHINVVSKLLESGAKINMTTKNGRTALHMASQNGQYEVVSKLLELGAKVNTQAEDGTTPFSIARQKGHITVSMLIRKYLAKNNLENKTTTPVAKLLHQKATKSLFQASQIHKNPAQIAHNPLILTNWKD